MMEMWKRDKKRGMRFYAQKVVAFDADRLEALEAEVSALRNELGALTAWVKKNESP